MKKLCLPEEPAWLICWRRHISEENPEFMMRATTANTVRDAGKQRQGSRWLGQRNCVAYHIIWGNTYCVLGSASETRAFNLFHPALPQLNWLWWGKKMLQMTRKKGNYCLDPARMEHKKEQLKVVPRKIWSSITGPRWDKWVDWIISAVECNLFRCDRNQSRDDNSH